MQRAIIVQGRLTTPTTVELDEPVDGVTGAVQVILRRLDDSSTPTDMHEAESVFDFLRRLASGRRTRDDIDHQVRDERQSWERR